MREQGYTVGKLKYRIQMMPPVLLVVGGLALVALLSSLIDSPSPRRREDPSARTKELEGAIRKVQAFGGAVEEDRVRAAVWSGAEALSVLANVVRSSDLSTRPALMALFRRLHTIVTRYATQQRMVKGQTISDIRRWIAEAANWTRSY